MSVTPLGSGQEVGRSCHVLEFRGMKIMLDIGIHPGYDGLNGLPFLDRVELDQIDVLLVTHFHLDHAASLPFLTERTSFKGRIFMTHPTKAVLRLLLGDYLRLLQMKNAKSEDVLYTEAELQTCIEKVELIDYHTTVTVKGLSFHALNAGHVLGACMYWMDVGVGRSCTLAITAWKTTGTSWRPSCPSNSRTCSLSRARTGCKYTRVGPSGRRASRGPLSAS